MLVRPLCYIGEWNIAAAKLTRQYLCPEEHTLYLHAECETCFKEMNVAAEYYAIWLKNTMGDRDAPHVHVCQTYSLILVSSAADWFSSVDLLEIDSD